MIVPPPRELVARFLPFFRDELVPALIVLDQSFPVTWTSWYRDRINNERVGGDPRSQHLLAWAVDGVVQATDLNSFVQAASQLGFTVVDEGDHVHLQAFPAGVIPEHFFV